MSKFKGLSKWELDTPCLVLDLDKLELNLKKMQEFAVNAGKKLRPHAKTHKCSRIASMQIAAGSIGICVAKISEAKALIKAGIKDILVTSPVVTDIKIKNLIECLALAPELMLVVDNFDNAQKLNAVLKSVGLQLNVLIDINPDMGRTGISYAEAFCLGKFISELPFLNLKGIQCYAGHLQHIASFEERKKASLDCLGKAAAVFRQLKSEKIDVSIMTGTGTGTHDIDILIPEVTDLQVGSYTVMDTEYADIGSLNNPTTFDKFAPAMTILASVVSTNQPHSFTVDAGLKAIYHLEKAPPRILRPANKNWKFSWFGDEHGKITVNSSSEKLPLGAVIEMTASHCDPTINLHDSFHITKDDMVIDEWPIDLRGCCR